MLGSEAAVEILTEERSDEVSQVERTLEEDGVEGEGEGEGEGGGEVDILEEERVHDVSGKTWELSLLDGSEGEVKGLYVYKNAFNLIPRSIQRFGRLKTLKFFANEINLFPSETGSLVDLECLQVKFSSPGLSGLPLQKLKALKELELCKVPPRPSAFPILSEIANLKCLTKLSVCHFSIRYLPPEIGYLNKLQYLDLSYNKLKNLPNEITGLNALEVLKVANNKLVELPPDLYCLQNLETLDLSYNKLTSLGPLKLAAMQCLRRLNLQFNKLLNCCEIPSWICCNLEGNGKDTSNDEFISSLTEVDVFEETIQKFEKNHSYKGSHGVSSEISSNCRCSTARRMGKTWKRRDYLQQKARQERLNSIRKLRSEGHQEIMIKKVEEKCMLPDVSSESVCESDCLADCESISLSECESGILKDLDEDIEGTLEGDDSSSIFDNHKDDDNIIIDSSEISEEHDCDCSGEDKSSSTNLLDKTITKRSGDSESEVPSKAPNAKRHFDVDLEKPRPGKRNKVDHISNISSKYSTESFCSTMDRLPDGFYDAGRDRPFNSLQSYEQSLCLDSREVILVDRERDEDLAVIIKSAQALVSPLKQSQKPVKDKEQLDVDDLQRASLLALFVSNWFGGIDRSNLIARTRNSVDGKKYQKPFVCTCTTGNSENATSMKQGLSIAEKFNINDMCESSLRIIKQTRNSNVVPIGTLRWGICRHRAVLMKYLCDRIDPPIPCELVRGYLDFMPHAWNIVVVRRDDSLVRMVVDACCPTDIREETDPEFFCRYLPLRRSHASESTESTVSLDCCNPSLSFREEIGTTSLRSIIPCKFGSVEAVAKVRTLKTCGVSVEEIKNFEYTCLGEVRLLGALKKHPCIVEIYGHQISSTWIPPVDGDKECRLLRSAIVMEHVEGGALNSYLQKLKECGEKHVPLELALSIAKDVACALAELHSKDIIHRDIKSENILIDLDKKRADGSPVIKLCDFDRAVPLRSFSHTCCISHHGIPPPNVCVGTPRWMAPEVFQAMNTRNIYGLEVDIWSYGCLLLELLTLDVPYISVKSDSDIQNKIQSGERPPELEGIKAETGSLSFLVDLFHQCTQGKPENRPTAKEVYDMLNAHSS